jgi:hypothetical protein
LVQRERGHPDIQRTTYLHVLGANAASWTADDQINSFQTENLDEAGHLIKQISSAIILAGFENYDRG